MPGSTFRWNRAAWCIVDEKGQIIREAKVSSEPAALAALFAGLAFPVIRIGLEAGPLVAVAARGVDGCRLRSGLAGNPARQAALSAMTVKTDRKDARGIAQLLRMGWFRSVHRKSLPAQETRVLLTARKLLLGKMIDIEVAIRGLLRGFGLKVGLASRLGFAGRVHELIAGQAMLESVIEPLLRCREALRTEFAKLHRQLLAIVRQDGDMSAVDDGTGRWAGGGADLYFGDRRSCAVQIIACRRRSFRPDAAEYQSGETDVSGGITKAGDAMVRATLYEAALVLLFKARPSSLKAWGMMVARRRGAKRALVAVARKLATVLHRMWVDGSEFHWNREEGAASA